jgi:fucose 4-O-acetylase-like acetyltransferase
MGGTVAQRAWIFAVAAAAVAFVTPSVRTLPPGSLPDPLQAYITPVAGLGNFVFFPWLAMVFGGAVIGVLLDAATNPADERSVNLRLAAGAAALLVMALIASYLPPLSLHSSFWTTSASYLFMRVAIVAMMVAACYAWSRMSGGWSPLAQLGRTSLFIYWIHVEMVYGLISLPLHRALSLPAAFAAYVAFCGFMLACSLLKDAIVERYRARAVEGVGTDTLNDRRRMTS